MKISRAGLLGLKLFAATMTYSLALVYAYVRFSYSDYAYLGFQLNESASSVTAILLAAGSSVMTLLLPRSIQKPSDLLSVLMFLLVYVPAVNVGYYAIAHPSYSHGELVFVYSLCMVILMCVPRFGARRSIASVSTDPRLYWIGSLILTLVFTCIVAFYYRTNFASLFSLEDISALYDIRFGYRETGRDVPTIVQYLFSWLAKLFWPLVLIIGLHRGSKPLVFFSFFGFFVLLATSGHKSIILGYFLVVGFWFLWREKDGVRTLTVARFALSIVLLALVLELIGFSMVLDVLIRRSMLIPGILSSFYHDFFSTNPKTMLGYSVLSGIVQYPYSNAPPFLIGDYYFGRAEMSANANFIAAGFAEFGAVGAVGVSLIAAYVYRLLDAITKSKKAFRMGTALTVAPSWALVDTSLFTVLVTHGLLVLLIALYVLPRQPAQQFVVGK